MAKGKKVKFPEKIYLDKRSPGDHAFILLDTQDDIDNFYLDNASTDEEVIEVIEYIKGKTRLIKESPRIVTMT